MTDEKRGAVLAEAERTGQRMESASLDSVEPGGKFSERFAALKTQHQQFIFKWAKIVSETDPDLSARFFKAAPAVFEVLDEIGVEAWLLSALKAFDDEDRDKAFRVLAEPADFIANYVFQHSRCTFDSASQFLQHFVIGLGGRELIITKHHEAYTDTEKIFLPDHIKDYLEPELNFSLYKLTAVHLWAQARYGTWRFQVVEVLGRISNNTAALGVFNRLECIRLDACIARELPGIHRQFEALGYFSDEHKDQWRNLRAELIDLTKPSASALDSAALIERYLEDGRQLPVLKRYQGKMDLAGVRKAMTARIKREKEAVQEALSELQRAIQQLTQGDDRNGDDQEGRFTIVDAEDQAQGDGPRLELYYDDELIQMTPEIKDLMQSILQDFGDIPEQYMEGVARVPYISDRDADLGDEGFDPVENDTGNAICYREWDYLRQRYRQDYCLMNELDVPPVNDNFVEMTLDKYRGLLKSIKKTFEVVLGESKLLRRQSHGDDIDIDALVEARADLVSGQEMSDCVYTRYRKRERNVAVMFMVDMSGSTHGWINDAERESLILLSEALETLGDRYAIYGFSGKTNKRCETYRIKRFDESYSALVRQRISGIRSKGFTRMGVAIRHLGHLLNKTQARTKILITLSDGRPEDYDAYRGRYAVEDTRHALQELRQEGIHSFCITIDKEAQDYLPHLYGAGNYAVIHEVKKLPLKVADIYRRLTSL